ncbi:MAG: hypothetical protein ABR886_00980 [Dehalococcoidales bacterium]|jgi:hypothetical protein
MVTQEHHHEEIVKAMAAQLKPVLEKSGQAIYIYLDDAHKVCNKKFADLLGYKSPAEWAKMEAPLSDVVEEDQDAVIDAYTNASEKMVAGCLDVRVKNIETGKTIKTNMIIVPVTDSGTHVFTVHFLSRK